LSPGIFIPGVFYTKKIFSVKERLIELLRQVNHDSVWGAAIQRSLRGDHDIDVLIRELKSQVEDCPECMVRVIGQEAVNLLNLLSIQK
jgi:hypothetical protein